MTHESAVSLGRDIDFDGSARGTKLLGLTVRPTEENQEFLLWVTLIGREKTSGQPRAAFEVKKDLVTLATATLRPDDSPDHFLVSTRHDDPDDVEFTLRARDDGGDAEMLAGTSLVVESPKADFTVVEKFSARPAIGSVGDLALVWEPSDSRLRATWTEAEHAAYHMWRHDQGTGTWTDWERVDGNSVNISSPAQGSTYNIEVRGHRSEDDFGPTATADVDVPPGSRLTSWTTSYLTWYTTRWREPDRTTCRETWTVTCTDTRPPTTTCWEPLTVTCTDTTPNTITCSDTWTVTCTDTTKETTTCWTACEQLSTVTCTATSSVSRWQTTAGHDTTRQTSHITEPLPPEPEHETIYGTTYFTVLPGGRQTSRTMTWTTCWTTRWESCFKTCTKTATTTEICRTIHYQTCWAVPMPPMRTCWTIRYPTTCWTTPGSPTRICWTTRYPICWTVPGRTRSRQTCHTTSHVTSGTTRYLPE